jgi:hypothetical protein
LLAGACGDAELDGALDAFFDGEMVMGDAELGDVSNFGRIKIALGGEVAAFPEYFAVGFSLDAGDGLQESGFSAPGRSDDGDEVAAGKTDGGLVNEIDIFAAALDGKADVLEFEHGVLGGLKVGGRGRYGGLRMRLRA